MSGAAIRGGAPDLGGLLSGRTVSGRQRASFWFYFWVETVGAVLLFGVA
jgi:hypothetical protein